MVANELNLHASVTDREFRSVLAEARRLGIEPKIQKGSEGQILFATLPVTLYVKPRTGSYSIASIHDRTYSRTLLHIEQ